MEEFLLDTDICVHFLKGKFGIKKKIEEVGISNCCISDTSLGLICISLE